MNSAVQLHYTRYGSGEPLVLLHGWSMNSQVWQAVQSDLADHWELYCIDLPGHGRSANIDAGGVNASFQAWGDAVLAVAPSQARWLAWSLGGTIALALAARAPQRITQLDLITATPKFIVSDNWPHAVRDIVWQRFVKAFQEDPVLANQQFMQLQALGVCGSRELGRKLQHIQTTGGEPSAAAMMLGLQFLQALDLRQTLQDIQCPLSLLLGEHDKLIPAAVKEDLLQIKSNLCIEVIAGAGHVPFLSHPQAFLNALHAE